MKAQARQGFLVNKVVNQDILPNAALRAGLRQQQLLQSIGSLVERIEHWLTRRKQLDVDAKGLYLGRHETQLKVVSDVLLGAGRELLSQVKHLSLLAESGENYSKCRQYEEATTWLERLWLFIRSKFDQRDGDDVLAHTLRAADEVIWSCYRQVFLKAAALQAGVRQGPVPLAFVEPEYSPAAMQSARQLPPDLRLVSDIEELDVFLQKMPLPMLRLPPWCLNAPWWLIFIGHEVGHHIQSELGIVSSFAACVAAAAAAKGLEKSDQEKWQRWGEEIFADAFSVFTMGPGAVWAMTEMEWNTASEMVRRKSFYPAPVIRLALMTRLAEKLGLPGGALVPYAELEALAAQATDSARDLTLIDAVVDVILGDVSPSLGTLDKLCGFTPTVFAKGKTVDRWGESLRGVGAVAEEQKLESARHIASGALAGWAAISSDSDEARRDKQLPVLRKEALVALRASAMPGVRSEIGVYTKPLPTSSEFAEMLLHPRGKV